MRDLSFDETDVVEISNIHSDMENMIHDDIFTGNKLIVDLNEYKRIIEEYWEERLK